MSRRASAAALLLLAFALRCFRLGEANVWWDEALAVWAVRKSFVETTLWTAADVHPPLFFWLQWPWLRMAGQTELALRLAPVGVGVLGAALAYALGRRLGGSRAGLLALAFVAVSRFEVWWSMELRMYMLAGTLILLASYAAARWLGAAVHGGHSWLPNRGWLAAYVFAATCALYTIYMAFVAIGSLAMSGMVLLAWSARSGGPASRAAMRRRLIAWIAAHVAVVALLLPWLALALPRMQSWSSLRDVPASAAFVARLWATLLATGVSTAIDAVQWWTAAFWACVLALPLLLSWLARRHETTRIADPAIGFSWVLLGPFLVLPPLAVWAATQPRSVFYSPSVEARYLLPFAGPVYVLAAIVLGRVWLRSRLAGWALALGAASALLVTLPDHYGPRRLRDEMQSMTLAIWSQSEPGDAVVLLSGNRYPMFLYYYDRPWDVNHAARPYAWPRSSPPSWSNRPDVIPFPNRSTDTVDGLAWEDELDRIVATHDRVWLAEIESHLQDPNDLVEAWLNDRVPRVLSEGYGPNVLHLYDPTGEQPQVTAVSSYWPWVRDVVHPADPWPWWPRTARSPTAWRASDYHPIVGAPAAHALAGDAPGFTLFERGEPAVRDRPNVGVKRDAPRDPERVDSPLNAIWAVSETRAPEHWAPQWSQRGPERAAASIGPQRVLMQIPVSDRFPAGPGEVRAQLEGDALAPLTVRGDHPLLAGVERVSADFGSVRLIGAAVEDVNVRPGDPIVVDLYWSLGDAVGDPPPAVFVHLVGPPRPESSDPVWAGHDGEPSSGPWRTQAVDTVYDRHVLHVDAAAPPGAYQLVTGLYDPVSMQRYAVSGELPAVDASVRHVVLAHITVD